ncbi:MAG TPA: hypothetical protein VK553_05650, partial [Candidatus Nitrosopolaris rasttigaisensis]|nr:hypothetical protein [Candidatus Nitrosopolaris rasttigaisensis]
MTDQQNENQVEQKQNDKEYNFRALEQRYEKQLAQERTARMEAEKLAQENQRNVKNDDDDDSEPYVDHKNLEKKFNKFGQTTHSEIQKAMETAKQSAKEELKQEMWLENNPDFYETLKHAEKLAQKAPKLAESILRMPEGFERQKLVYQNIKAMDLDKAPAKEQTIQQKVDANRKSPFYSP